MDRALLVRVLALYVPVSLAMVVGWRRVRSSRHVAAILAGLCWCLISLPALQILNLQLSSSSLGWSFHSGGALLRSMPVELYLGWVVLWGVLPVLCFPRLRVAWAVALLVGLDLILMPVCSPVIELSKAWLVGEGTAVLLVLLPSQLFSRWTWDDIHLRGRAFLWAITAVALLLFLFPEIIFAVTRTGGWPTLLAQPAWLRSLSLQAVILLGIPALSAAQEFARRGLGTPIPFDPPQKLVCSGLYRYLASPMQTSGALVLAFWGLLLRSPWVVAAGGVTFIYGGGIARWHEGLDMRRRFGDAWLRYSSHVPGWRPRWKPWHDPASAMPRLYIAESCGPCSQVRRWFDHRNPVALDLRAAEDHPTADLTRITYDPMDGTPTEAGVTAFARGLEHINLAWALLGAFLRLPVIAPLAQILADAAGFGPRLIERRSSQCPIA
jgi:protein-S-isoprenylcysteine O-methyltransferase Ste14